MSDERTRIVVYSPESGDGSGRAGLAVSYNPHPNHHETKFTVEQLWPPAPHEDSGRAEPVYVGDAQRVAGLIEALAEALQIDAELAHLEASDD